MVETHQGEWERHRTLFAIDAIKADFDLGKSAKISAERLMIRHKGERAAYGLDEGKSEAEIVIRNSRRFDVG